MALSWIGSQPTTTLAGAVCDALEVIICNPRTPNFAGQLAAFERAEHATGGVSRCLFGKQGHLATYDSKNIHECALGDLLLLRLLRLFLDKVLQGRVDPAQQLTQLLSSRGVPVPLGAAQASPQGQATFRGNLDRFLAALEDAEAITGAANWRDIVLARSQGAASGQFLDVLIIADLQQQLQGLSANSSASELAQAIRDIVEKHDKMMLEVARVYGLPRSLLGASKQEEQRSGVKFGGQRWQQRESTSERSSGGGSTGTSQGSTRGSTGTSQGSTQERGRARQPCAPCTTAGLQGDEAAHSPRDCYMKCTKRGCTEYALPHRVRDCTMAALRKEAGASRGCRPKLSTGQPRAWTARARRPAWSAGARAFA